MKQKIEWYKEVLELEPGSKVFFPLARMQAEDGQTEAALATLRHGLGRNPEHLEARLLLIDLLSGVDESEGMWPEVDAVSQMLGDYPGFWTAWTRRMSGNPQSRDAALALNFLSHSLNGKSISWSDVIEHGLGQLLSGNMPAPVQTPAPKAEQPVQEQPDVAFDIAGMSALAQGLSEPAAPKPDVAPVAEPAIEPDEEEEQFSLKTRSMAEVLAAQGDYIGALDIYEELLKEAKSEEEKISLEDAIARLSADVSAVPASSDASPEKASVQEKQGKGQDKGRLLDVLEMLADRLESKAE